MLKQVLDFDIVLFIAVTLYCHGQKICWVGVCGGEGKEPTLSSYMFHFSTAILYSQYCWWPKRGGDPPPCVIYILVKVWIAMLLTNLTEQFIWPFIVNITEAFLNFLSDILSWIFQTVGLDSVAESVEGLKSETVIEVFLCIIALWAFFKFAHVDAFISMLQEKWKEMNSKPEEEEDEEDPYMQDMRDCMCRHRRNRQKDKEIYQKYISLDTMNMKEGRRRGRRRRTCGECRESRKSDYSPEEFSCDEEVPNT